MERVKGNLRQNNYFSAPLIYIKFIANICINLYQCLHTRGRGGNEFIKIYCTQLLRICSVNLDIVLQIKWKIIQVQDFSSNALKLKHCISLLKALSDKYKSDNIQTRQITKCKFNKIRILKYWVKRKKYTCFRGTTKMTCFWISDKQFDYFKTFHCQIKDICNCAEFCSSAYLQLTIVKLF